MSAAYVELIRDRNLIMLQVHAQSACDVPEIRDAVRRGSRKSSAPSRGCPARTRARCNASSRTASSATSSSKPTSAPSTRAGRAPSAPESATDPQLSTDRPRYPTAAVLFAQDVTDQSVTYQNGVPMNADSTHLATKSRPARSRGARGPADRKRSAGRPGAGAAPGRRRGDGRLLRRAADAPRPVLRPAAVPLRARLRPGRHGPRDRRGGRPALVGKRVAALTKIGGWASHVVVDAARRGAGARRRSTRPRRRPSWSTASPPGRCCTARRASAPARPSWCTAPTAASARSWSSSPAHAGVRGDRHSVRRATTTPCAAGVEPVDYTDRTSPTASGSCPPGRGRGVRQHRRAHDARLLRAAGAARGARLLRHHRGGQRAPAAW